LSQSSIYEQENDALFARLRGISPKGITDFFMVDGIMITSQKFNIEFSAENCTKVFSEYAKNEPYYLKSGAAEIELVSDNLLDINNFHAYQSIEVLPNFFKHFAYYYVEGVDKKMIQIIFGYLNKRDVAFERNFINLVRNNLIPQSVYDNNSPIVRNINFAGRDISFPAEYLCRWGGPNQLQSFADGEIGWSLHKDLEDASFHTNNLFLKDMLEEAEIVSDATIDVIFEGVETTARKVVYEVSGTLKRTMTAYYIATPIRNYFVSCVLSFWNTDQINESGLPFLLEQVIELK
jgi:hypothetical protein